MTPWLLSSQSNTLHRRSVPSMCVWGQNKPEVWRLMGEIEKDNKGASCLVASLWVIPCFFPTCFNCPGLSPGHRLGKCSQIWGVFGVSAIMKGEDPRPVPTPRTPTIGASSSSPSRSRVRWSPGFPGMGPAHSCGSHHSAPCFRN
jgi:hypothetical protein